VPVEFELYNALVQMSFLRIKIINTLRYHHHHYHHRLLSERK